MKKILKGRKESQENFEKLRSSFETAVKTKPFHLVHRTESLEKLRDEFMSK